MDENITFTVEKGFYRYCDALPDNVILGISNKGHRTKILPLFEINISEIQNPNDIIEKLVKEKFLDAGLKKYVCCEDLKRLTSTSLFSEEIKKGKLFYIAEECFYLCAGWDQHYEYKILVTLEKLETER